MRSMLFVALAAMLAATSPVLADGPPVGQGGKGVAGGRPGAPAQAGQAGQPGGAGVAQPGIVQPGRPGIGIGVQPGGVPGFPPGQPPDFREMMMKQMARNLGLRIPPVSVKWGGMVLEPADAALLDQLDLPAGKGMVITAVDADSAAAKAGLKKYDLVVKVNAQAVPGDARELIKTLGDTKADTPVELAVVRKGKEQTLKGVKLPEATLAGGPKLAGGGVGGPAGPPFPRPPVIGVPPQPPVGAPPIVGQPPFVPGGGIGGGVRVDALDGKISINRNNDQFDCAYQKDKLQVTVRGKVANNQATAEQITVDDGKETKKYDKVQDVPQAQRTIINRLLQMVNGGGNFPRFPVPPALPGAGAAPPAPGIPGRPQP